MGKELSFLELEPETFPFGWNVEGETLRRHSVNSWPFVLVSRPECTTSARRNVTSGGRPGALIWYGRGGGVVGSDEGRSPGKI